MCAHMRACVRAPSCVRARMRACTFVCDSACVLTQNRSCARALANLRTCHCTNALKHPRKCSCT